MSDIATDLMTEEWVWAEDIKCMVGEPRLRSPTKVGLSGLLEAMVYSGICSGKLYIQTYPKSLSSQPAKVGFGSPRVGSGHQAPYFDAQACVRWPAHIKITRDIRQRRQNRH